MTGSPKNSDDNPEKCTWCNGRGYLHCQCWPGDCICGYGDETCEECGGDGFFYEDNYYYDDPNEMQPMK